MTMASRAVLAVVRGTLLGSFGGRVYRDLAPAGTDYPFVILSIVNAESSYEHQRRPELVTVRAIVVDDDAAGADGGAFLVEGAINLKGTQQATSGALDAGSYGWEVVIVRKVRDQAPPMELDQGRMVFRAGADYRFKLERS